MKGLSPFFSYLVLFPMESGVGQLQYSIYVINKVSVTDSHNSLNTSLQKYSPQLDEHYFESLLAQIY